MLFHQKQFQKKDKSYDKIELEIEDDDEYSDQSNNKIIQEKQLQQQSSLRSNFSQSSSHLSCNSSNSSHHSQLSLTDLENTKTTRRLFMIGSNLREFAKLLQAKTKTKILKQQFEGNRGMIQFESSFLSSAILQCISDHKVEKIKLLSSKNKKSESVIQQFLQGGRFIYNNQENNKDSSMNYEEEDIFYDNNKAYICFEQQDDDQLSGSVKIKKKRTSASDDGDNRRGKSGQRKISNYCQHQQQSQQQQQQQLLQIKEEDEEEAILVDLIFEIGRNKIKNEYELQQYIFNGPNKDEMKRIWRIAMKNTAQLKAALDFQKQVVLLQNEQQQLQNSYLQNQQQQQQIHNCFKIDNNQNKVFIGKEGSCNCYHHFQKANNLNTNEGMGDISNNSIIRNNNQIQNLNINHHLQQQKENLDQQSEINNHKNVLLQPSNQFSFIRDQYQQQKTSIDEVIIIEENDNSQIVTTPATINQQSLIANQEYIKQDQLQILPLPPNISSKNKCEQLTEQHILSQQEESLFKRQINQEIMAEQQHSDNHIQIDRQEIESKGKKLILKEKEKEQQIQDIPGFNKHIDRQNQGWIERGKNRNSSPFHNNLSSKPVTYKSGSKSPTLARQQQQQQQQQQTTFNQQINQINLTK